MVHRFEGKGWSRERREKVQLGVDVCFVSACMVAGLTEDDIGKEEGEREYVGESKPASEGEVTDREELADAEGGEE